MPLDFLETLGIFQFVLDYVMNVAPGFPFFIIVYHSLLYTCVMTRMTSEGYMI